MQYPLTLTFKLWALAPQILVTDASGNVVFYIRQKLFKLKEAIGVFADSEQTQLRYEIKADRILDFSARYAFSDPYQREVGAVKRRGWRSIWRARYEIFWGDVVSFTISEKNPWVKVMDSLLAEIPVLGIFTSYVFNPIYLVSRPDSNLVMRLEKQPAFFSRIFTIKKTDRLDDKEETQILLSLLMMILLERRRG
ncbi:MAG: hypothetical protein HC816_07450 [Leptolyngbyaceae cyanobacterium RM1_1_2]|nr:hypothetical protein [Leptolyngbyaceae cyanobacterium RM1_1_2]